MKANMELRMKLEKNRIKNWEVADRVGISDGRFSVWLRTPLTENRYERVQQAVDELINESSKGMR